MLCPKGFADGMLFALPSSTLLQVVKASDEPLEGAKGKKSQKQRLLDELYHKYCIGEGAKSDGQVGAGGRGWVQSMCRFLLYLLIAFAVMAA